MGTATRREFLKIGAIGAASAALGSLGLPEFLSAADKGSRPNIVVVLADDQGYADLGCQGLKGIPTPNIDSIAANGIRFTSSYVSCPVCSPTRAGLMTGRYQTRFGHEFNPGPPAKAEKHFGLPVDEVTIADRLKAAGYVTGAIGKWHLGYEPQFHPLKRGFDEFFGFPGGAHDYLNPKADPLNLIYRGTEVVDEKEYLTDAFAREAKSFVRRHAGHPFFLYLAFNAVHSPMQATEKYLARFPDIADQKQRRYAAMLSAMDDAVGVVLSELRANNLEENTLVIYLSDNGMPENYARPGNVPLKGFKGHTYEGGIRVPFLAQFKGRLPAGKVYDKPVISLDIHATALALAGHAEPVEARGHKLDGVDLMPFLTGANTGRPHETLFWRYGYRRAVRRGDMKLVWIDGGEPELYDLAADSGETKNLASEKPDTVKELTALYEKWNAEMVPAEWGGLPPENRRSCARVSDPAPCRPKVSRHPGCVAHFLHRNTRARCALEWAGEIGG